MAKGSYSVDNEQPPRKDTSFKSFICSLLIFLALCLIILLATIKWGNSNGDEYHQKPEMNNKNDVEVFNDKDKNNTARIVVVSVPETITNPEIQTTIAPVGAETTRASTTTTTTERSATTRATAFFRLFTGTRAFVTTTEKPIATTISEPFTETLNATTSPMTRASVVAFAATGGTTRKTVATTISEESTETTDNSVFLPRKFIGTGGTTEGNVATTSLEIDSSTESSFFATTTPIYSLFKPRIFVGFTTEAEKSTDFSLTTSTTTTEDDSTETYPTIDENSTNFPLTTQNYNFNSTTPRTFTTAITTSSTTTPFTNTTTSTTTATPFTNTTSTTTTTPFTNTTSTTTTTPFTNTTTSMTTTPPFANTTTSTTTTTPFTNAIMTPTSTTTRFTTTSTSTVTTPQNLLAPKSEICTTSLCNQTTSRILSSIKHSIGPCEDFYEFACGGNSFPTPENFEETLNNAFLSYLVNMENSPDQFYQNFDKLYKSCVQYEDFFRYNERIKNVKELIEDVSQFGDKINTRQSFDVTQLFANLLLRQSLPFFDFALDIDENSMFTLQLTIPDRGSLKSNLKDWSHLHWHQQYCLRKENLKLFTEYLDLNEIYESLENCRRNYSNYLNSIEETIRQLGIFSHLNPTQVLSEIKDIRFTIEFDILNQIDKFPTSAEIELAYLNKEYSYITVSDLQKYSPIIDWIVLLKNVTGYDFKPSDRIQVYFWPRFYQIFQSLEAVSERNLNNALLAIYANNLYQHTVIPRSTTNRDLYCLDLSKQLLPDVAFFTIQTLYVEKIETGQRLIGNLFDLLKQQFQMSLFERDWLDENSTEILMEQFLKIHLEEFPKNFDKQLVNKNHQRLAIDANYQKNLIKLIMNRKRTVWELTGKPATSQLIYLNFLKTLTMEALTIQENGSIVIPFGLLYRLEPNLPSYLTVSQIGLYLARAIVRNFDKHLMRRSLSDDAIKYYNYLLYGTEDQVMYFSPRIFEQRNITFKFNGSLSINERIIDNAALRLILDTLDNSTMLYNKLLPWISDNYPPDRVVFIAAGQEYCKRETIVDFMLKIFESPNLPAPLKIQNIISNSEGFTEKFKCPDGAGMNLIEDKLEFPYLVNQEESYQTLYGN